MKTLAISFTAFLSMAIMLAAVSCGKEGELGAAHDNDDNDETLDLIITLPFTINGAAGDVISVKFYPGKGPKAGDCVVLKKGGVETICEIVMIENDSFSFKIADDVETGQYSFAIRKGDTTQIIKDVQFNIDKGIKVLPKDGYNIYGIITCGEEGVPGVVVSDGIEVTVTDKDGIYYLKSDEYNQVVFMSIPSGYEVVSDGIIPKFHKMVDGNGATVERADWTLNKVDNSDHIMYILGDMHLANRTKDLSQFADFTADLQMQVEANKAKRQYALTLGDMTWDLYWYDNKYDLQSYIETINSSLTDLQLFHTIGNHDHEMNMAGDFNTVAAYKKSVAPTYYSFNIGDIHYVVLDNILCTNDGYGSRKYDSSLTFEQIEWLRKDISYVDKSKTIVITMHAQLYNDGGTAQMEYASELENICAGYNTHVMTAHTHVIYNNDKLESNGLFHHNSGAICGTWWWTGYYTSGLGICKDGSPSGYYVYEMNGNDVKWRLKPTGKDFNHMFRTYDRNSIELNGANFAPEANSSNAAKFEISASHWANPSFDNYVYINVFDYDPSWKIEVTENGEKLNHEAVKVKDPLHLAAYEAMRYNVNANPTKSFLASTVNTHIFRVKASSATSTLEIKVTDRFGNTASETMIRPKEFTLATYR